MTERNQREPLSRFIKKRRQKLDSPPGDLTYIGDERKGPVDIDVIDYNQESHKEFKTKNQEEAFDYQ